MELKIAKYKDLDEKIKILNIEEGTKVVLQKGKFFEDPKAIRVILKNGLEVGYIAAKSRTAGSYPLASDAFDKLPSGNVEGTISKVSPDLVVSVCTSGEKRVEIIGQLCGNKVEFPARMLVYNDARKHAVDVTYKIVRDRIVIYYKEQPCGCIAAQCSKLTSKLTAEKGITVSSQDDIQSFLETAKNVTATTFGPTPTLFVVKFVGTVQEETKPTIRNKVVDIDEYIHDMNEDDAECIKRRVEWLRKIKVAEYAVGLFLNRISKRKGLSPFQPTYIPQGKEIENAIAFSIGDQNHKGNILCVGPAGSGKNRFVETIANLFSVPLIDQTCSAGIDEDSLFGYVSLKADQNRPEAEVVNTAFNKLISSMAFIRADKSELASGTPEEKAEKIEGLINKLDDGADLSVLCDAIRSNTAEVQFEPSIITKMLEKPCVIDFDEVNTLRPQIASALHSVLDNRRKLFLNDYRNVHLHPDTIVMATMNEGNEYAGTQEMNLAFEDRFHVIEFNAPRSIEKILIQEVPALPRKAAIQLDKIYKKMLSGRENLDDRAFSIRSFIYAAVNVAVGNSVRGAVDAVILPKIRDLDNRKVVQEMVDLVL